MTGTRQPKLADDFDDAAEDIHRAFCDPEHEAVGPWDRDMADALRRRGLRIVREAAPQPGERERALEEALTWALAIVDQYDHHLRRGMYLGDFTRQYIDRKEEALAALAHQQPEAPR